jgi:uncharacterized glyoxalase superfamily protein PhnB
MLTNGIILPTRRVNETTEPRKEGLMTTAKNTKTTVIPALRYSDAPAAIEWLCDTFGFERQMVVPDEQGGIAHAQLSFGNGMIMLGSVRESEFGTLLKQPKEIGLAETQSPYLVVENADTVYERAKAAGAEIVIEIKDEDYGGRGFSCRDLEGHLWSLGTYDPWETLSDKRIYPRVPLFLDVRWEGAGGKNEAHTSDISLGGCFIDTIGQVAAGEIVSFKLSLPSGESIELQGEVRYELPRFGFGVKFKDLTDDSQKQLQALCQAPE